MGSWLSALGSRLPAAPPRRGTGAVRHSRLAIAPGAIALGAIALAAAPVRAQVTVTLDAGASNVEYEEFLRASAFTLAPTVRYDRGGITLQGRGAFSHFEGGSRSVQGIGTVSLLSPARFGMRGEFFAELGSTRYERFIDDESITTNNILVAGRLHAGNTVAGGWAGGGAGVVSPNFRFPDDVFRLSAGAWRRTGDAVFTVEVAPSRVADSVFTDLLAGVRWMRPRGELAVSAGYRGGDEIGNIDRWLELNGTLWIARNLALVGGVGQYPAEVLRGLPGGRYVAAAVRVATRPPAINDPVRRAELTLPYELRLLRRSSGARRFVVDADPSGARRLRVLVEGARRVELMADFTDWTAVPLEADGPDAWVLTIFVAPGVHRVNLRIDGGGWTVPPGLTAVRDDFGGEVGLLVVQ